MAIKPCNACNACINKPAKECVIDDDMQQIYLALRSADSIVITSPIYCFNMSAQTKLVIDRLYGLIEPNRHVLKGKKIAIILVMATRTKLLLERIMLSSPSKRHSGI